MNDGFHIDVQGFDELKEKIKKLADPRDKKREVLGILRQVAGATVARARQLAPVSKKPHVARKVLINPGNLKKSIGTITGRKGNAAINPTIYAGPRVKGNNKGWYGAMVEAGHKKAQQVIPTTTEKFQQLLANTLFLYPVPSLMRGDSYPEKRLRGDCANLSGVLFTLWKDETLKPIIINFINHKC